MGTDKLQDKLVEIISDYLDVPEEAVHPDSLLVEDFGADSLAMIELRMVVEEEFSVTIPEEDAQKFRTVQDVLDSINASRCRCGAGN